MQRTDISTVMTFVNRTVGRGVPVRVAIARAARRYKMQPELIRAFYRSEH